ncbi:MAG: tRNA (adenosine(37)-N6)-threonylcarbamoyltransferase complex dimerization subunit type 1 TsaB [Cryomorphaceae bacterium]
MATSLLLIETASHRCDVALIDGKQLLVERGSLDLKGYQHAEKLHVYIQEVLQAAGKRIADLDGVAISGGPGSYTGLRIGAASAKGLVIPHDLPLIAYSSLAALAHGAIEILGVQDPSVRIWAAMDARRMEVYSAVFDGHGCRLSPDAPQLLEEFPIHPEAGTSLKVLGVGDGVEKALEGWTGLQAIPLAFAHARHGHALALEAYEAKDFVEVGAYAPNYLKTYVAGKPKLGLPGV